MQNPCKEEVTSNGKCCLCKGGRSEIFLETPGGNYLRCVNCGLVLFDNIPDMSEIKSIYCDEYFTEKKRNGCGADFLGEEHLYLARFKNRLERIEKKIAKGRILDIGASVGQFLFAAKERGWDISGVEVSAAAVQMAKQRYGINIQAGALEDARIQEGPFDVITLWHVFEHFPGPVQALKKIHALLKKDGCLVMEVPNIGSREALLNGANWAYLRPGEHLYHYTRDTITGTLEAAGFTVETIEYGSGGTGIGEKMDRLGMGRVKKLLSKFRIAKWLRAAALFLTAKGSKEVMIVFARKKG